jgi:hypothetical protein
MWLPDVGLPITIRYLGEFVQGSDRRLSKLGK